MEASNTRLIVERRLQRNLETLRKSFPAFVRDAVNEHALNIQARTKEIITRGSGGAAAGPAVDTGQYRASIKIETFSNGNAKRVGSDLKYAPFIEFGTGPRSKMPPLEPIRRWCRRHRIPEEAAFAIALKIKERGTPARPSLFPAYELERPKFLLLIRAAYSNVRRQIV